MENPFKYPREMDGLQSALAGLPTAGVYVLGAVLAAGLGGAGVFGAGALAPEGARQAARYAAGAAGAALGAFLTVQLRSKRQSAAIIELSNLLVSMDPTQLTRDQVAAIEAKYGASLASTNVEDLKAIYSTFVEAVIPPGDASLSGQEPVLIQRFKEALALSDVDAAPAHIEAGRRLLRGRMEAGSRGEDAEARKTFQKLIYVSNLVFGDRQAAFLLPWTRVFGLSDAQVYVAKRDNAKGIFKQYLDAHGGQLQADKEFLVGLRRAQADARLADDEAASLVKEAARARVEALFETAVKCTKQRTRTRDYSEAMQAMHAAVAFNRGLASLQSDAEVIAGVAPTSLLGGAWVEAEGRSKDLRELFKIFLEERLQMDGGFTDSLESDAAELRKLMGLGNRECADIEADVKQAAYKRLLREEVTSGRLSAAASKAEVLGELVDRVRFDPDAAKEFHESLYRQKLASLVEKKKLTDEDDKALRDMQVQLCIPNDRRDALHEQLCGSIFKDVANEAMSAGIDGFGFDDREAVQRTYRDLRLTRAQAEATLREVGRKYLLQFVTQSRNTRSPLDAAKELKKMVFFSNIVLAPLLDDFKSEEEKAEEKAKAQQQKEIMEMMRKAQEEAQAKEREQAEAAARGEPATAPDTKADSAQAAGADKPVGDAPTEAQAEAELKAAEAEAQELLAQAKGEPSPTPANQAANVEAAVEAAVGGDAGSAAADAAKQAGEAVQSAAQGDEQAAGEAKVKSLAKAELAAAARATGEKLGEGGPLMRSQKEINLGEDLEVRDRMDIYKKFLLYCMTGDVVQGPMGVTMVTERDEGEFARLSQLGDILGLSQMDVYQVHTGMAEQAFRSQVQSVLGDGVLTPDRAAALEKMREQMGLPKENADKIIRGFSNQKAIAGLQSLKAQGRLSLDKVLELREAGVPVTDILGDGERQKLYRDEVVAKLSDGTGDFSRERMLEQLPQDLGIDGGKAAKVVAEAAKERKRTTLVQAISFLRQKKVGDAAKALNNLLSCEAAAPSEAPASWQEREELADLFSAYVSKESSEEKQAAAQRLLGLNDDEASSLRQVVASGGFKLAEQEAEETASFF